MIKRTIEISRQPMHLSARLDQLICQPFEADKSEATSIPAEDIGLLLVDHPQVTYTHGAFQTLLDKGAAVLLCGRDHLPAGLLLPISTQTEQVTRLRLQIEASRPLCKQLWRHVVIAKVRAQAALHEPESPTYRKLMVLAGEVKSGDTTNIEAQAAKIHWSTWREEFAGFARDPDGNDPINAQLNYGYAVLRAAVARALVAAGLHPALGIHHANRSNAFCLADDLVEPLRPIVDQQVRKLQRAGRADLSQANKAALLSLLAVTTTLTPATPATPGRSGRQSNAEGDNGAGGGTSGGNSGGGGVSGGTSGGPLMVQLHRVVASLVRSFEEKKVLLELPRLLEWDG